jgi:hypothetical protein
LRGGPLINRDRRLAGIGGIAFAVALVVGFTFFGPRGGFYAALAVDSFVDQSATNIVISVYLLAVSTMGLCMLMAYLSETQLSAARHARMAWGTSLLAGASFLIGWGIYFAPSIAVLSGGPAIDPAISYTFTGAGMIILFGVGGLLLGTALLTLAVASREAPMWVRALNALTGLSALFSFAFILASHWSPNQWLPIPFYLVVLWGIVIGAWLVVSSGRPATQALS